MVYSEVQISLAAGKSFKQPLRVESINVSN